MSRSVGWLWSWSAAQTLGKKGKPQQTEMPPPQNNFPGYLHSFTVSLSYLTFAGNTILIYDEESPRYCEAHLCGKLSHVCMWASGLYKRRWNQMRKCLFFREAFPVTCRCCCNVKLYFHPSISKWKCMSGRYWNLLWHLQSWKVQRGTPFSDSFSASPPGQCSCLQFVFPVQLWLRSTKFIGVWHSPATLISPEFAERWFYYKDLSKGSGRVIPGSCSWWNILSSSTLWPSLLCPQNQNFSGFFACFSLFSMSRVQRRGWACRQSLLHLAADYVRLQVT